MRSLSSILKTRRGIPPFAPTNWVLQTSAYPTSNALAVGYGNGEFAALSTESVQTAPSLDVTSWTAIKNFSYHNYVVKYFGGYWIAAGKDGRLFTATNPSGVWTERSSGFGTGNAIQDVGYDGTTYAIVGHLGRLSTATNPTGVWTARNSGFSVNISNIKNNGTNWVIVGYDGKLSTAIDPTGVWTARNSGFGTDTGFNGILSVSYGGGYWVASGVFGRISTSVDSITWVRGADIGGNHFYCTEYGSGYWLRQKDGTDGLCYYASDPTGVWTELDLSHFTQNGYSYVGSNNNNVISYDSITGTWVMVGRNRVYEGMILTCSAP